MEGLILILTQTFSHPCFMRLKKRQTRSFANNVKIENNLCQEEESQRNLKKKNFQGC